jgi:hypothetical protein
MDLEEERWNVLWATQKSQRYHARRCAHYDRLHTFTTFCGVMAVSASFSAFAELVPRSISIYFGVLFFAFAAYDLVARTSSRSRVHDELRRRFCRLEMDINRKAEPTLMDVNRWKNRKLEIELDEPAIFMVIDLLSENELYRIYPHLADRPLYKITRAQRLFGGWFRYQNILEKENIDSPRNRKSDHLLSPPSNSS